MSDGSTTRAGDRARTAGVGGDPGNAGGDRAAERARDRARWTAEILLIGLILVVLGFGLENRMAVEMLRLVCYVYLLVAVAGLWNSRNEDV